VLTKCYHTTLWKAFLTLFTIILPPCNFYRQMYCLTKQYLIRQHKIENTYIWAIKVKRLQHRLHNVYKPCYLGIIKNLSPCSLYCSDGIKGIASCSKVDSGRLRGEENKIVLNINQSTLLQVYYCNSPKSYPYNNTWLQFNHLIIWLKNIVPTSSTAADSV